MQERIYYVQCTPVYFLRLETFLPLPSQCPQHTVLSNSRQNRDIRFRERMRNATHQNIRNDDRGEVFGLSRFLAPEDARLNEN